MPLNVTRVFIKKAAEALVDARLEYDEEEALCDALIELCEKYAPGTFKSEENEE